jgi:hypothetical protein
MLFVRLRTFRIIAAVIFLLSAALGQDQPAPAEKPPLRYDGKPILLEYNCTEDEIRAAGLSCSLEDPCPVFLELDSVETVGNTVFLAGNIHTATTTVASLLLASDDEGKSWREPYQRVPLAGLDRIQFVDFENGWVAGELQHPLPHDPFMLVTSDGGRSWQAQPLFGDQQFGSILEFSFSSAKNGSLIVDQGRSSDAGRYQLLETTNGGASWSLRQASDRLLQLKHGRGETDWRIKEDAATKAHRIERHAGEAWRMVASFSISLGACKPPEPPAVPPQESVVGGPPQ